MKRVALALIAAVGAGVALVPGPAGAGGGGETVVTSESRPSGGYALSVTAASGQANNIVIDVDFGPTRLVVTDTAAGITDSSPRCVQEGPSEVRCQLQGLRRILAYGKDGNDTLRADTPTDVVLLGGEAALTVRGQGGNDTLRGVRGNQWLLGGGGGDTITGGRGNRDHCDGQAGTDSGGGGCEEIISIP